MAPNDRAARAAQAEAAEDEAISQAIAGTEEEIFTEATGSEEDDNTGDRSLEEMEDPLGGDSEEEDDSEEDEDSETEDGEEEEAAGEELDGETPPRRDERDNARVPSFRLREATERAERAEREAAEFKSRLDQLSGKVDGLTTAIRPPQQTTAPQRPDMFADPEAWENSVRTEARTEAQRAARETFVNANMDATREEFGEEFDFAYSEIMKGKDDPATQQAAARILSAPNPGRALMAWAEPKLEAFRSARDQQLENQLAERFGVEPEDLERALAIVRKGSGNRSPSRNSQGNQARRLPPSLNSQGGGGANRPRVDPRGQDGSEGAIFADAFKV